MRSNYTKTILIALLLASSGPTLATHQGTWHGGDRPSTSDLFCHALGDVAGESAESLCLAVFE